MSEGPRWLAWLGTRVLPPARREVELGDVLELYAARRERMGSFRASVRAVCDLIGSALAGHGGGPGPDPGPAQPRRASVGETLLLDIRLAFRTLRRELRFAGLTMLTLGLGIGAVTAVFAMINEVVLRPHPGMTEGPQAGYLAFRTGTEPLATEGITTVDFDRLRAVVEGADGIASHGLIGVHARVDAGRPIDVLGSVVYGDFFEVLGTRPVEGRLLGADDTAVGADPLVAVLSSELATRLFGSPRGVVARTVEMNGQRVRVIGVAEPGFRGPSPNNAELWVPFGALVPLVDFPQETLLSRTSGMHDDIIVHLAEGTTPQAFEEQVAVVLESIADAVPEDREYLSGLVPQYVPHLNQPPNGRERSRQALTALAAIVVAVLLVACSNVANLLLVRNVRYRGRTAVMRALGASEGRVARSHLIQSLVLGSGGTIVGLAVAWGLYLPLRGEGVLGMPVFEAFVVDHRVLAFAASSTLATTVLFGALPAILAGRVDLMGALRTSGGTETGRLGLLRQCIAAAQIAVSLALLIGGLLLTRTVRNLFDVDTGMTIEAVASVTVELGRDVPADVQAARVQDLVRTVASVSGVTEAAVSLYGPYGPRMQGRLRVGPEDPLVVAETVPVTSRWFSMLEIRGADGDPIDVEEVSWRDDGVVLSAALARRLYGSESAAIGRTLMLRLRGERDVTVVGVTAELRRPWEPDVGREAVFFPFDAEILPVTTVVFRAERLDVEVSSAVRAAIEVALPDVPVADPRPVVERLAEIHSEQRIFSRLVGVLSWLTALMAAVGLYGLVSFSVAERSREFGVRISVGARWRDIAALVTRYAGSVVLVGGAVGLLSGFVLSSVLDSRLYGVTSVDPWTYAAASAVTALTAAIACWAPTRRAVAVDPVRVLRSD